LNAKWTVSVAAAVLLAMNGASAVAATTDPDPTPLELQNAELSRSAAAQGMVLLENNDQALPIAPDSTVALFGVGAYATVKGGTGSGNVNNRYTINVRTGLENAGYTVTTSDAYWSAMTEAYDDAYGDSGSGSGFGSTIDYASVEQELTDESVQPTEPTDTAIYVVARNSGEGADRTSEAGDYLLTSTETADVAAIGKTYEHVVVVLNVGGIIDTSFMRTLNADGSAVDALLVMSQAGQESGNALADVLSGAVTPSGKLTDTWAAAYDDYPAAQTFGANDDDIDGEQYSEGIYVGYRYFDSFDQELGSDTVSYPFGYGLSYTDFAVTPMSVTATQKTVTVTVRVRNSGRTYSGQEVVQVYVSAPQKGLDKPYQQLVGYAKTDQLAPGASQVLKIRYRTADMASYDRDAARYVLDAGDYAVRVGTSSRDTQVAAKLRLAKRVTTQIVNHETDDATPDEIITSDPADFYGYPGQARELAKAPVITLRSKGFPTVDNRSAQEQDVNVDSSSPYYEIDGDTISSTTAYLDVEDTDWEGTGEAYQAKTGETVKKVRTSSAATLTDVAEGRISMTRFVAGLDLDQLADIVEGARAGGSVAQATGAAGYTTAEYEDLDIPGMVLSDGPAGLRLTQQVDTDPPTYQYQTAWPIGTLLAQTWDRELIQEVGDAIGQEMVDAGVTLWLAPGMNIHRDPLNGRNFEYFSEDPLVTGLTAAAETLGVQANPGVGVTIKHYVANNQEANRNAVDEVIDERAIREIYARGFQIAVESAQPMAVMTAYNKINGTYASANYDLVTDMLRGEWGFEGLVMSDWGGSHNPVATMYAGNDLIEPGNNPTEITSNIKKVVPGLDVTGLPLTSSVVFGSYNSTTWSLAGLSLDANGKETISTTVDADTDLSAVASTITTYDEGLNASTEARGPYSTVADAYADAQTLLEGDSLTDAQKAAIAVAPTYGDDGTTVVVAYTVTLQGSYPDSYTMRLGDLQRSAARILNVAMQSRPFEELTGREVGAYSSGFDLEQIVTTTKGAVRQ